MVTALARYCLSSSSSLSLSSLELSIDFLGDVTSGIACLGDVTLEVLTFFEM